MEVKQVGTVDRIRRIAEKIKIQKRPYERVWYESIAFLLGNQKIRFDKKRGEWVIDYRVPSWRIRLQINRLLPIFMREFARLTSGPPYFDVLPATDDPEDQARAEISQKVLDYLWQEGVLSIEEKREGLVWWALTTGTGILKVEWDPDAGVEISAPAEMENEVLGGGPNASVKTGDIKVSVVSPFEFFVDDRYHDINQAPYVVHYYTLQKSVFAQRWPDKVKEVSFSREAPWVRMYAERMRGLVSPDQEFPYIQNLVPTHDEDKLIVVFEIWEKPRDADDFPGRVTVATFDTVLERHEWPFNFSEYPFVIFRDFEVQNRFWGMSLLSQLVDPQRLYNRLRSSELMQLEYMANPKLVHYPAGRINPEELNGRPGGLVRCFAPGYEPKFLERQGAHPAQFESMQQWIVSDMEEISSQHEVSRGTTPRNVESGLALSWLSQKDEMSVVPRIRRLNRALEDLARKLLRLFAQYVEFPRLIKVVGVNKEVEARMFVGSDLVGPDPMRDYFDVRVRPSSTMPTNKAAQKNEILAFMQAGILNPQNPHDRRYILRMLDLGDARDFYLEDRLDEARAKKEIEMLKNGQQVQAMPHENHMIHIDVFMRYMKTDEFYSLPPEDQQRFIDHVDQHNAYIQSAMEAAAPMPPESGGGGQNQLEALLGKGGGGQGMATLTDLGQQSYGQQNKYVNPVYGTGG